MIKPQEVTNSLTDPIERLFTREFLVDQGFKISPNEEFYYEEYIKNAYLFYDYPLIGWEIAPIIKDLTDGFITEDEALILIKEKYELYHNN